MDLDQQRRYARQIMLPEVGEAGQRKLLDARVLVVGAGGLGSLLITSLAACGVGHLGMIDDDRVELSNLPRQTLFETGDIGRLKVEAASDRVAELNPECTVAIYPTLLDENNAREVISAYDIVADGCDNFATRFLVNDTCVALGIPLVSAAISGFHGQVMTIMHGSADYRALVHPDAPEANTCHESGVMGPLAALIGSAQALEVVRVILGIPTLVGKVMIVDGLANTQRVVTLSAA